MNDESMPRATVLIAAATSAQPIPLIPAIATTGVSRRAWQGLAVASMGTVLAGFNSTATNIALTDIERGLGATKTSVGWGVAAYFIATAALLPLGGRLADRIGRKKVFQAGLVLFAVSSVLSWGAPDVWTLNAARVLQAAAGAAVLPSSLALVLPLFPESRRSGAVGLWSAAGPLAAGIAPFASAAILNGAGWRVVYLVTAPAAVAMWFVARRILDELPVSDDGERLDIVGAVAGTVGVAAIVAAIMQGVRWGYGSPITITVALLGIISMAVFVRGSFRHPAPILNLKLLSRRGVVVVNGANFLVSITSLSIWLVWPKFLLGVYGYSTIGTGLGVTLGPLVAGSSTVLFSRLSDRFGQIFFIRLGSALQVCAVSWHLLRLDGELNYWTDFAPGIMLYGLGWGMSAPLLNSVALKWIEERFWGEANGLFNTLRYAAAAVGTGAVFAILTQDDGPLSLPFYDRVLGFFVLCSAAGFLSLWIPMGTPPVHDDTQRPVGSSR
ncbi:MAG: MFS family permease [Candidatus Poriferisodalaceae bacterium]